MPDCPNLPFCWADGCQGFCTSDLWMEEHMSESHFHDCAWWFGETCTCAERTRARAYYACCSNYCDDPACVSNQPDHPSYFPHPEVL